MAKKIVWAVPLFVLLVGFAAYSAWPTTSEQPAPGPTSTATAAIDRPTTAATTAAAAATGERLPDRELVPAPAAGEADPGFASLRVVVRWQHDGSAAKSVGIGVFPKRGSQLLSRNAATDAEGVAVLRHIAPGSYWLQGTHIDEAPDLDLVADQQQTVELQAKRACTVRGRVVDHDGAPVADASICEEDDWSSEFGRSDAGGNFAVPLKNYCNLAAHKAGHVSSYARTVDPRSGKDLDIELALRGKAGTVRGTVRDASGAGIPWATVLVGMSGGHVVSSGSPDIHLTMCKATRMLTGRDGEFTAEDVAPGRSELRAWAVGHGPTHESFEVRAGEVMERTITLAAGCTVAGVVRDASGQPVASVGVQFGEEFAIFAAYAIAAADGTFRLSNLPAGNVRLSAGKDASKATTTLKLTAGTTTEWNPVLGKGRTIAGTVLGPDDRPFAGAKVGTVHPNYQQVMKWFETDAAGRFELPNVGDNPAPLQVESDGASLVETGKIAPDTRDVVIRIGERDLPTARLRGRVVDTLGRPIAGSVFLRRAHITNGDAQQLDKATGGFAFGPMPASRYDVDVWTQSHGELALGTIDLEPGQERVLDDVVMHEPGAVELTVFDAAGKPADAKHTMLRSAAGLRAQGCEIQRGKGKLGVLQPGRYFFECSTGRAQMAVAEFVVQSGTTSQVELHGRDVVQTTIRFRDPEPANPDLSVTLLVRTREGQFATFAETYPQGPEPLAQRLSLPIGTYRIDCTTSDGRRVAAEIKVGSLDDQPALTIDLPRR